MTDYKWMIYGAYGVTGRLVVEEALRQGHRPLLSGRSAEKLKPMAEELGLDWLAFDLADKDNIIKALAGVGLVLNIAGPFNLTARPLIEACLSTGTHYLDIANEIEVFKQVVTFDAAARTKNIALLSGVGFGTVATNFLVSKIAGKIPNPHSLELVIASYNQYASAGAANTAFEVIAGGGKVYHKGKLTSFRLGKGSKKMAFPDGSERTLVPVPLGDLFTAHRLTGIPEIKVFMEYPSTAITRLMMPVFQQALKLKFVRERLKKPTNTDATLAPATDKKSYTWAKVTDEYGKSVEGWLEMEEGYHFTARACVRAVEQVFKLKPTGALTPAQAFEANFIEEIGGKF